MDISTIESSEKQYKLYERGIEVLRDVKGFSAKGRNWDITITDEPMVGNFIDIYVDEKVLIRSTPYWEGFHLPIDILVDDCYMVYDKTYPLEDMTSSSDEELKEYIIQNLKKAVEDIPVSFEKYILNNA